jgi:hypothetical protein
MIKVAASGTGVGCTVVGRSGVVTGVVVGPDRCENNGVGAEKDNGSGVISAGDGVGF